MVRAVEDISRQICGQLEDEAAAENPTPDSAGADEDCHPVSPLVRESYTEEAATTDADVGPEVLATPSRAVPGVWFISMSVKGLPAVWAMDGHPFGSELGLTMVANAVAREHSDLGVDIPADAPAPVAQAVREDPGGIAAAEACITG